MADTPTTRNRLRKLEPGQYANSWGPEQNEDFGSDRLDQALDGLVSFALSGNKTLSSTNYETDEARMRMVIITSGTGGNVTIPSVEKWYLVLNLASGTVTFKTSGGTTNADVPAGTLAPVMCDGAKCYTQPLASYMLAAAASAAAALASQNAAATSASAASTSATNASNSASAASTSATNASNSASAASTSASAASTSATNAGNSATAAAGSATTATTQAGIATTKASEAAASAVLAQAAATYQVSIAVTTWTALAAITGSANQTAAVFGDAGTHTDPVVGGTVNNSGVYRYSTAPAGWQRVGELGGIWTQIATSTPTGTGTVDFTAIPSSYQDLLLVFSGISHNNGAGQQLQLAVSSDNVTFTTLANIGPAALAASAEMHGSIFIPNYRRFSGAMSGALATAPSAAPQFINGAGGANNNFGVWKLAAAMSALRVAWSAGNFDAGTLTLYGK